MQIKLRCFLLYWNESLVCVFSFAKAQSCSQTSPCVISTCNDLQSIKLADSTVYYILTNNILIPLLTFCLHHKIKLQKTKRIALVCKTLCLLEAPASVTLSKAIWMDKTFPSATSTLTSLVHKHQSVRPE